MLKKLGALYFGERTIDLVEFFLKESGAYEAVKFYSHYQEGNRIKTKDLENFIRDQPWEVKK